MNLLLILFFVFLCNASFAEDILVADFEKGDYGDWQISGKAFGYGPTRGAIPDQPYILGFLSERLANSHHGGVKATGILTSPPFKIERDYINFLIAGGYHPGNRLDIKVPKDFWGDECCVNLLVDDTGLPLSFDILNKGHHRLAVEDRVVIRTKTGTGLRPDGAVELQWATWDVRTLRGKTAQIQLVDNYAGSEGFICADHIIQSDTPRRDILHDADVLQRANENVKRAERTARPRRGYHYVPTVFGIGSGPTCVYHNGYYHLFHIYDPFWNPRKVIYPHSFWRHARSKDLVYWEEMDVEIWPSVDAGEFVCQAGAVVTGDDGVPMIFYTGLSSERPLVQIGAVGNADLTNWRKLSTNPVITDTPDNPMTHGTDCSVFKHADRWYMILGGQRKVGDQYKGCFSLHASDDLIKWEFISVPYTAETRGWEEPEMFQLGDKWVVIFEPFGPTQYYTGRFDWENYRFHPEVHSFVDFVGSEKHIPMVHGHAEYTGQFYGCTPFEDKNGRRIYMGLATGGLSLPRVLSLRPDGKLAQRPIEALSKLRRENYTVSDMNLVDSSHLIHGIEGNMLEIKVAFIPGTAKEFGLRMCRSEDGTRFVPISFDGQHLVVSGERIPADLMLGESALRLHIFLDQYIMEVFANNWVVYTKNISVPPADLGIELFSDGGRTTVKNLDIWKMASIW